MTISKVISLVIDQFILKLKFNTTYYCIVLYDNNNKIILLIFKALAKIFTHTCLTIV